MADVHITPDLIQTIIVEKIPGTTLVKFSCQKCSYPFKYDPYRKMPKACPYCDADIPNLKAFTV